MSRHIQTYSVTALGPNGQTLTETWSIPKKDLNAFIEDKLGEGWFELMVIFLLLGVITSTQVLSYPLVAESNCSSVVGTAEGLSAVLIMSGGFLQPLFGYLLQYHAKHPGSAHALYTASQLQHAMLRFPCAFLLSFFVAFLLRDVQRTA